MLRLDWQDHSFGTVATHGAIQATVETGRKIALWRIQVGKALIAEGDERSEHAAKHAAEAALVGVLQDLLAVSRRFPELSGKA